MCYVIVSKRFVTDKKTGISNLGPVFFIYLVRVALPPEYKPDADNPYITPVKTIFISKFHCANPTEIIIPNPNDNKGAYFPGKPSSFINETKPVNNAIIAIPVSIILYIY